MIQVSTTASLPDLRRINVGDNAVVTQPVIEPDAKSCDIIVRGKLAQFRLAVSDGREIELVAPLHQLKHARHGEAVKGQDVSLHGEFGNEVVQPLEFCPDRRTLIVGLRRDAPDLLM